MQRVSYRIFLPNPPIICSPLSYHVILWEGCSPLSHIWGGRGEGVVSTEGEICLCRGRFFYGGGDLSTAGRICLRRGICLQRGDSSRFFYGWGDLSTEGEIHLQRGRLLRRGRFKLLRMHYFQNIWILFHNPNPLKHTGAFTSHNKQTTVC
jgi:hypothetical protein